MRLWTIQGIAIYEQLQKDGVAYCTHPDWSDYEEIMHAYHWMAAQMRKRIGNPPVQGIEFPLWAWYQYDSAKRKKPTRSPINCCEGLSAFMEIEIPEHQVLLSDFSNWHTALNLCALTDWKRISKKTEQLDELAGRRLLFKEYPKDIQKEIENSWEAIFDLDRRDKTVGRTYKKNRSIQATFWALYPENVCSVEFLERKGDNVKTYKEIVSLTN